MRALALCLFLGVVIGDGIVHRRAASPVIARIPIPVADIRPVEAPALPPPVVRGDCSVAPQRIGQPLAALPLQAPSGGSYWQVAAAAERCVIAAWSDATLVASWDDGATFTPILESRTKIRGVTVRADGTIFVMRDDFTLGIVHSDGATTSRTLTFRGDLWGRGRWLVVYTGTTAAISDDDGASWRQLDTGHGYLTDLRVLDNGTIVAWLDLHSEVCDHFGCGSPTDETIESHLDGRPWRPATPRHIRAASVARKAAALAPDRPWINADTVLDSHRLVLDVAAQRSIVRYTRLLFTGAS